MRSRARSRTAAHVVLSSLVACGVTPDPDIRERVELVDGERLRAHVEALCAIGPRPAGFAEQTERTLVYLETQLRKYGYEPRRERFAAYVLQLRRRVEHDGSVTLVGSRSVGNQHNLIAEHTGTTEPRTVVELGAHYDTVMQSPGADDDASGVAAALEVARLVADRETDRTIRFVFFAMEEDGLVGSREHVRMLANEDRLPEGMLSMDMIGFASSEPGSQQVPVRIPLLFSPPDVGDFTLVAGNFSSGWLGELFEQCIDAYVPELPYYSLNRMAGWFGDATRGDHYSYWQAGVPAIALVDGMEYRNPHYHGRDDLPATLDANFLRHNTQAVLATMLEWAGRPRP